MSPTSPNRSKRGCRSWHKKDCYILEIDIHQVVLPKSSSDLEITKPSYLHDSTVGQVINPEAGHPVNITWWPSERHSGWILFWKIRITMLFLKFVTFHFFLEMTNQYFPMWKSVRFLNSVCFKIIWNQKKWIRQKFHKSSAAPAAAARPRPGPLPIPRVTPVPPETNRI